MAGSKIPGIGEHGIGLNDLPLGEMLTYLQENIEFPPALVQQITNQQAASPDLSPDLSPYISSLFHNLSVGFGTNSLTWSSSPYATTKSINTGLSTAYACSVVHNGTYNSFFFPILSTACSGSSIIVGGLSPPGGAPSTSIGLTWIAIGVL